MDSNDNLLKRIKSKIKNRIESGFAITNYILKYYLVPTIIFCVLFLLGLTLIGCFTFHSKELTIGIAVLLFLALILGLLTVISLVAMFREVGRLHARVFPKDAIDQIGELNKNFDRLRNDFDKKMVRPETITELNNTCAELKASVNSIENEMVKQTDVSNILDKINECWESVKTPVDQPSSAGG